MTNSSAAPIRSRQFTLRQLFAMLATASLLGAAYHWLGLAAVPAIAGVVAAAVLGAWWRFVLNLNAPPLLGCYTFVAWLTVAGMFFAFNSEEQFLAIAFIPTALCVFWVLQRLLGNR